MTQFAGRQFAGRLFAGRLFRAPVIAPRPRKLLELPCALVPGP